MSDTIRCGIIGCGVIGPAHIESYQRLENVQVTWVCDLVEEKARKAAAKYGIANVTTDFREVLADPAVDAVSVCTDHASHSPITVAALDAGKHVLCEKALAATAAGMDAMFAAHERRPDLVFSGVFQHRFDASFQYLKRLVSEGAFGQILTGGVQVRCFRSKEYYRADEWRGTWAKEGGSVLINQAIHFIDSLVWIMDGVESLCGTHRNLTHGDSMETEDTAVAVLKFRSGALGTVEATCSSHLSWEPTISIHGSDGSIEVRNGATLKVRFADAATEQRVKADFASLSDQARIEAGKSYYGPNHPTQIEDFILAIREKRAPFVEARSARHTVDVVLAIYESHRTGRWVTLRR